MLRPRPPLGSRGGARVRHHRALGGRQGDADPRADGAPAPARAVGVRHHPRAAAGRARRRRLPLPHAARSSTAGRRKGTSSSTPTTPGAATARCAPSSRTAFAPACRSCSRSRCRAPARCAPRCPRRCRCSSRRPRLPRCARAWSGAAPTTTDEVERRLQVAEQELAAQPEFAHVVVNDRLDEALERLTAIVSEQLD